MITSHLLCKERITELEVENERLYRVIREKHLFAGLGCKRCVTVGDENTDYSGWTFNEGEGWLCPKHTLAELADLRKWQSIARAVNPTVGEYCDGRMSKEARP